ncbi:hypothetical protein AJ88_15515 [Mesorhizobium amorphae CCBAU 01583]|nr:hypothetical protein AJ88_15515 [Mesorhizobium amorphae CCBAU 01583]
MLPRLQCRSIDIDGTFIDRAPHALNKRTDILSLAQQLSTGPQVLQALLVELGQPFLAPLFLFNPLPLCTLLGFPQAKSELFLSRHDDCSGNLSDL